MTLPLTGTLTVVDLDGTLVNGNTLHVFMRCSLAAMIRQKRLYTAVKFCIMAFMRKLKLVSHRRMKFYVLAITVADDTFRKDFVNKIKSKIRRSVIEEIERCRREGSKILLVTAAADIYVPWIWQEDYIATSTFGNVAHKECRGTVKAEAVRQYAEKNSLKVHTVITDHLDDLPLLSLPDVRRILVAPSATTLAAVNFAGLFPHRIID